MRFDVRQRFPGPLAAVETALLDADFLVRLGELPTIDVPEVLEQRREGDVVHQRVRYRFTAPLSPVVTRVIDPRRLSWVEVSTVDLAGHRTEFRMLPDHYPDRLSCSGSSRLSATADGAATVRVTSADLVVQVALVAGRVESAIISGLREHADREAELMGHWLAERQTGG